MWITYDHGTPSTLADVLGQVRDALSAMADATTVMVGKKYLANFERGSAPRVLFVPETDGSWSPSGELGDAATVVHGCQVFVLGASSHDDIERFQSAYAIADRVMSLLRVAASGRLEGGRYGDPDINDHDADLTFGFRFRRHVRHDRKRWALAPADPDTSRPEARPPVGEAYELGGLSVIVDPKESA